ncbi:ABC transporter substrate-binding protein [Bradyrhizobium sp.]|jgi:peptide/nickel transport system substrate-binding protein|uniref:ABC transporter substrate-binding protein n=1 Tax=Bradyrhizobium sp. TaxID=376 RepID=UPI002DDD0283|nr:ABC transporter substrate-binding protein [Bradyrhizobium sp.]HEV2155777.1 ABC transporter substrate-binding protein [Bradyrhizobium sp.]
MMFRLMAIVAGLGLALAAPAEAQTPRKGGTVRMTAPYGSSFTSLDIHTTQRAQDEIYAKALHRSLYIWNSAEGKPVLELAKEDVVSGGGLVHTFKLRDDAFFHNGRKMTADDVIWSYNRIMDGTKAYPGARFVRMIEGAAAVEKGQAKEISGLRKIDDFTVEMKLTEKVDPGFYFFTALTSIYPADEAAKEGFIQKPIGLGPFKFVEHVPGSRIVLERWDRFYKPGKPYADKVVVSIMGEAAARDVAFRNKEIDTSVLGPAQYVAYQNDADLKGTIVEVAEVFTRYMGMNPSFKPFADKRVRQAINLAIDTDLIINKLVKGKAYRATSWLPLTSPAYDKAMKPYAFDPAKAKQLLADAGYPSGFEFEWTTSQNESWGLPIVSAVIPMLDKVGIKAKVKQVEAAVLSEVVRSGDYQAFIYSQQTGPDPQAALKCFHSSTPQSACNYMTFKNAEFDKIIDEAGQVDDVAKRTQLLQKANALLYDEAPVWFFNYNKAVMAVQPWLHGVQLNATELTHQNVEDLWVDETSPAK